jgi:cysteine desulfurase
MPDKTVATKPVVYMDNNATTKVDPEVLAAMLPYFSELYGNPSSMHDFGGQVGPSLAKARQQVAKLIGAASDELIFTSCGTESDSTAILAALQAFPEKRHIVTTRVEHPAVKNLCEHLDRLTGHKHRVTQLPVDRDGLLDLEQYEAALSDDTAVVSVMWANNETGVIFPVEEMAGIAKSRGILFHTDAVQAVGKIPINLADSAIDFLSISGHKLHAPRALAPSMFARAPLLRR